MQRQTQETHRARTVTWIHFYYIEIHASPHIYASIDYNEKTAIYGVPFIHGLNTELC